MFLAGVAGFYTLHHKPSGRFYIGSSKDLENRMRCHKGDLNTGRHHSKALREVCTSWDDIYITYTPTESVEEARKWEKMLLAKFISHPMCCNSVIDNIEAVDGKRASPGRAPGFKTPDEVKEKMREAHRLRKYSHSEDIRKIMSAAKKRACVINGVEYDSVTAVCEAFGIGKSTASARLASTKPKFAGWVKK